MLTHGYKQSGVGVIPNDWSDPQIQDLCRLINGRGFKPYEWDTSGLPIIRIQNLNGSEDFNYFSGHFDPKILVDHRPNPPGFKDEWVTKPLPEVCQFRGGKAYEQFIDEAGDYVCVNSKFISPEGEVRKYSTKNFCPARKDDVLMVMNDLPNGRALAKAFLADQDNSYAVNQRVCALTAYKDCAAFLFYMLNRNPYFFRFDNGVSQTHLLNDVFQKCPVRLAPTIDEQTAIAEVLSDMDAEIAALERRREKTQLLKQGMMQELLTGKTRLV
jgi:type I restriction enzyme S subunit